MYSILAGAKPSRRATLTPFPSLHSGTLDVSLLWVSNSVFEVLAISGDPHLGGEDFTHNLVNLLVSQVAVLKHRKPSSATDMQQLRKAAEELKIRLSVETQANVTVSLFDEKMPIELSVTRSEFEEINDVLFARYALKLLHTLYALIVFAFFFFFSNQSSSTCHDGVARGWDLKGQCR